MAPLLYNRWHRGLSAHSLLTMSRQSVRHIITANALLIHLYKENEMKYISFTSLNGYICLKESECWKLYWCLVQRKSSVFGTERQVAFIRMGEEFILETDVYDFTNRIVLQSHDVEDILSSNLFNY